MTMPPAHAALLPALALIEVAGPDAAAFLQSQLSNDVRQISASQAQLSSWNSARGRMLAVLHVIAAGDAYWLELPRELVPTVLKRLRMFVLRSKVTLRALEDRVIHGLAGPGAARVLEQLGLPQPQMPLACAWHESLCVMKRLGSPARYSFIAPAAEGTVLAQRLAPLAAPAPPGFWRLADIEAGVPTVYPQTQDRFVPQMCNLDNLGGISFDKGCYPGQEVVARVHYRGAVKRHMRLLRLPGPPPAPGDTVALPEGGSGEIVDAGPQGDGAIALAVVGPPAP